MEPIKFKGVNSTFAENQEEYKPLPAHYSHDAEGNVTTCWKGTFKERLRFLLTGKMWLNSMTFNKPLQPLFMTTKRKEVIIYDTDAEWAQFQAEHGV